MNPDRIRWGDSRLDDAFQRLGTDMRACHEAVRELRKEVREYIEDQAQLVEAHRVERKSDRRWMVGVVFTAAGLIIAAVGLLTGGL